MTGTVTLSFTPLISDPRALPKAPTTDHVLSTTRSTGPSALEVLVCAEALPNPLDGSAGALGCAAPEFDGAGLVDEGLEGVAAPGFGIAAPGFGIAAPGLGIAELWEPRNIDDKSSVGLLLAPLITALAPPFGADLPTPARDEPFTLAPASGVLALSEGAL